jgi:hypothetical protein
MHRIKELKNWLRPNKRAVEPLMMMITIIIIIKVILSLCLIIKALWMKIYRE